MEIVEFAKNELKKFNDIKIDPVPHIYEDSKQTKYTSVTTFVKNYYHEFPRTKLAVTCAIRDGRPVDEILAEWDKKGAYARLLGTEVHAVMEHLWKGEENKPDYKAMGEYEGMVADFEYRKGICEDLYEKMSKVYVPIANEIIVNDPPLGLAGTIDFVAYNKRTDTIDILDWKTSKQFSMSNGNKMMKFPFDHFPNTNVYEYSLQLSLYKYIVEKYTDLKISELRLFQIPGKGKMKTAKCADLTDLIRKHIVGADLITEENRDLEILQYIK